MITTDAVLSSAWPLAHIFARLYQPEVKLTITGTANNNPSGKPTSNCRKTLFSFALFCCQYAINCFSRSVSIIIFVQKYNLRTYGTFSFFYLFVRQRFIVNWLVKPNYVKVDNLLGPYLYQYKKIFLPGIGLFTLDDKAVLPDDTAKIKSPIEGISFTAKTGGVLDDSLVQYIKQETGKMKALAEADLHSYIATAFQYLNIGKPFYFEGIGTLQKNKDNNYIFTAGTVIPQKIEDTPSRYNETGKKSTYNNDPEGKTRGNFNAGKLIVVLGVLVTLALIGWGGYYLYSKNTNDTAANLQTENKPAPARDSTTAATTTAVPDSSGKKPDSMDNSTKKDSAVVKTGSVATPSGGYKFVLEATQRKARALKRYEQLKDVTVLRNYNNKVGLETTDSVSFKLYTIVPCAANDTLRVKDQLNAWYYGTKEIKVKMDH
jgi:hypothetical protein